MQNNAFSKKWKVAFIGGGINSAVGSVHYAAINLDNNFELVAGCFSRNKEINRETALKYRVFPNRIFNSFEDLILNEKNKIDAAIILTPSDQHEYQVNKLLEVGIPIICEKSLTNSGKAALQIKNTLNRNNGFLTVIYNYLGYPIIRELKNIIGQGQLGKINCIQIEMPQESFIRKNAEDKPKTPQTWRLKDEGVPTISLDLGVHLHMLINYLTNEKPISVAAKCNHYGNFSSIVDDIHCIIEYSNQITCNMWYSKIAVGNRNGLKIRIFGTIGSAEWVQEYPETIQMADIYGRRWKIDRGNEEMQICTQERYTRFKAGHPAGFIEAFANYYQDIAAALHEFNTNQHLKFENCFGVDEALEGILLFEAIQKSCISKKWENIQ